MARMDPPLDLSHRIGRLEGRQEQTNIRLVELADQLKQTNTRLDRLLFALFGVGAGVVVMLVKQFPGG